MEVEAAGEDVGTGEAAEGEVGTVGAAADGLDLGFDAGHLHCLHGLLDNMVVRFYLFAHVIILVLDDGGGGAIAVLGIDGIGRGGHLLLALLELLPVVVADDVGEIGLLYGSLEGDEVEEALVAFRVFRTLAGGQQGIEFLADMDGVAHLSLGIAGVHVAALDVDLGAGSVEVLKLQLAYLAAVHGIAEIGPETGDVELDHAAADFFVGREADADLAVLELRMLHDVLHRVHNLGHAGLVVGAQQGGAVGGDEGLAHVVQHLGELRGLERQAGHALQGNLAAVVVLNDLRLHIGARSVRGGIHMGDEAHGRHILVQIGRDAGHHVPELIQRHLHAQGLEFVFQHLEQVPLLGSRRLGFGLFVALRVHRHVP